MDTISTEDKYFVPFFNKIPIAIEHGKGVYVWDEDGKKYIDFTSGWGVTSIGHANPVISEALASQGGKIMQNPNSGLTYAPARAQLLSLISTVLPGNLVNIFFTNSGAESNDAAIKLARKVSGRTDVISTIKSFHGRTISALSATGQEKHRSKFNPLMPNYKFVPFNDIDALDKKMDNNTAAVIIEPIQGEGGVNIPSEEYMKKVSELCVKNGSYLIVDEIQTGFCRTGSMFAVDGLNLKVDFLTMAKGMAGGFPFGAFAISKEIAEKIEIGDHGGTYCGNPLGCAVAHAVIKYLIDNKIEDNVKTIGKYIIDKLETYQNKYPVVITGARGKGLLIALEFQDSAVAAKIFDECLNNGLFINLTQGNIIRIFPALNITENEADEGLEILEKAIESILK